MANPLQNILDGVRKTLVGDATTGVRGDATFLDWFSPRQGTAHVMDGRRRWPVEITSSDTPCLVLGLPILTGEPILKSRNRSVLEATINLVGYVRSDRGNDVLEFFWLVRQALTKAEQKAGGRFNIADPATQGFQFKNHNSLQGPEDSAPNWWAWTFDLAIWFSVDPEKDF